jgi:Flp pilus assembly protein TadD
MLGRGLTLSLSLALLPIVPAAAQRAQMLVGLDTLEARASRDSLDPSAQYGVGLGYWNAGQFDDAERAFRRSLEIEPKFAVSYLALAYLPYARRPKLWEEEAKRKVPPAWRDALAESDRNYRRTFLLDPMVDLKVVALILPPTERAEAGVNATKYQADLINGYEYFWDARYYEAFELLDRTIQRVAGKDRPEKIPERLLWYRGLAAAHADKSDVALADFRLLMDRALEREKSDSVVRFASLASNDLRYVLATLTRKAGRPDDAIALLQESLTHDLSLYMAHAQLATIHEQRMRWPEAVAERERALETNPDDPSLLLDLGTTLAKARRFAEARDALQRAMQANPRNARIPFTLGQVQMLLGDRAGARESYVRFVAIAPSYFRPQIREATETLASLP